MKDFYCVKDKMITPSVEPSGYQTDKRGRTYFICRCGVCGNKKVRYLLSFEKDENDRTNLLYNCDNRKFLYLL